MKEESLSQHLQLTRAQFLKLAAAAGVTLVGGGSLSWAAENGMLTRQIPKSGEPLPVVGLGTARAFDVGGSREELARRKEVLKSLFAGGGSVIDTAPSYGRAETVIGVLLTDLGTRQKAFIASKVRARGRQSGIDQMENSLRRLRTKHIDLIQVHNLVDTKTQLKTLSEWKDNGRIRYTGITHYRPEASDELARLIQTEPVDFVQGQYSLGERRAEERLLPMAADRGVAVLVNLPYGRGRLFRAVRGRKLPDWAAQFDCASWGQFFLKYILSNKAVTCVIPGTANPKHMLDNLAAGRGRLPDAAQRRRMVEFWNSL